MNCDEVDQHEDISRPINTLAKLLGVDVSHSNSEVIYTDAATLQTPSSYIMPTHDVEGCAGLSEYPQSERAGSDAEPDPLISPWNSSVRIDALRTGISIRAPSCRIQVRQIGVTSLRGILSD